MRRFATLAVSYLFLCASPAFSWWETGHQVVARLAAARLSPAARTRLAHILDVADTPDAVTRNLARISTWADEARVQTGTGAWHYIDLTLEDTKEDMARRCPADNCAPARIRLFSAQLSSQALDQRWSELDALRFLVHFVGDLHQPLHAASDADLGGNCERLEPPIGTVKNLHSVWDGGIVNAISPSDQALTADLEAEIQTFSHQKQQEMAGGTPEDWAWESHQLAKHDAYWKLHVPVEPPVFPENCEQAPSDIANFHPQIDGLYLDDMKPIVRLQLERAGLRLAKVLNESL